MAIRNPRRMAMIYEKRFIRKGLLDFIARHIGMIESTPFVNSLEQTFIQELTGDDLLKKLKTIKCDFKKDIAKEMDYIITMD